MVAGLRQPACSTSYKPCTQASVPAHHLQMTPCCSPADEVLLVAGLSPAAQDAVHTVVPHRGLGGGGVTRALLLYRTNEEVWGGTVSACERLAWRRGVSMSRACGPRQDCLHTLCRAAMRHNAQAPEYYCCEPMPHFHLPAISRVGVQLVGSVEVSDLQGVSASP